MRNSSRYVVYSVTCYMQIIPEKWRLHYNSPSIEVWDIFKFSAVIFSNNSKEFVRVPVFTGYGFR